MGQNRGILKIIIDFDGTLTAEETQAGALAEKSLDTLASEILGAPRPQLAEEYEATRARLLAARPLDEVLRRLE